MEEARGSQGYDRWPNIAVGNNLDTKNICNTPPRRARMSVSSKLYTLECSLQVSPVEPGDEYLARVVVLGRMYT